jgi:hypothetical protein
VECIGSLIQEHLNPMDVSYATSDGETYFNAKDLRNYHWTKGTDFFAVIGRTAAKEVAI